MFDRSEVNAWFFCCFWEGVEKRIKENTCSKLNFVYKEKRTRMPQEFRWYCLRELANLNLKKKGKIGNRQ